MTRILSSWRQGSAARSGSSGSNSNNTRRISRSLLVVLITIGVASLRLRPHWNLDSSNQQDDSSIKTRSQEKFNGEENTNDDIDVIVGGTPYSLTVVDLQDRPEEGLTDEERKKAKILAEALPLPKPIIMVGLPRVETAALETFFRKSGYTISHDSRGLPTHEDRHRNAAAKCIHDAIEKGIQNPLYTCGNYDVWTQLHTVEFEESCHLPQVTHLDLLHEEAPQATFLLNLRDLEGWAKDVEQWQPAQFSSLSSRLNDCGSKVGQLRSSNRTDLVEWHANHLERIRQFVVDHPSHALMEVHLGEDQAITAQRLAKAFQGHVDNYPWIIHAKNARVHYNGLRGSSEEGEEGGSLP